MATEQIRGPSDQLYPLGNKLRISGFNVLNIFQGQPDGSLIDLNKEGLTVTVEMRDLINAIHQGYISSHTKWLQSHLYLDPRNDVIAMVYVDGEAQNLSRRQPKKPAFIREEKIVSQGQWEGTNQWELNPKDLESRLAQLNYTSDFIIAKYGEERIPIKRPLLRDKTDVVYQPGVGIWYAHLNYLPKDLLNSQSQLEEVKREHIRIQQNMLKDIQTIEEKINPEAPPLW